MSHGQKRDQMCQDEVMDRRLSSLLIFLIIILVPTKLHSEFYKYIDKKGTTHFVDNIGRIPVEYRNASEFHKKTKYDHLSEQERQALLEKEKKQREW